MNEKRESGVFMEEEKRPDHIVELGRVKFIGGISRGYLVVSIGYLKIYYKLESVEPGDLLISDVASAMEAWLESFYEGSFDGLITEGWRYETGD